MTIPIDNNEGNGKIKSKFLLKNTPILYSPVSRATDE